MPKKTKSSLNTQLIEYEIGLKFFGGNSPEYHRWLQQFVDANANNETLGLNAADSAQPNKITHWVHKLGGTSSMLGMKLLCQAADKLENIIRNAASATEIDKGLANLCNLLAATCEETRSVLAEKRIDK